MGFTWFDHIFIILIGIVIPTLSIMSGKLSLENTPDLPPKKHLFYSNGLMLIIGALLVLSSWNIGEKSWGVLGFSWPVIDQKVIWLICSMILLYVLDLIYSFFTSDLLNKKLDSLSHVIPLNWQEYKHYIFLSLSAGICEEIIFRGFLISYLSFYLTSIQNGQFIAIGIPALVFALSHLYQGKTAVIKIFLLSIILGLIFVFSKSLMIVIIAHIMIDLISGLMGVLVLKSPDESLSS